MDLKLLSGALGVEVNGIDIKDSSEENFKIINDLLLEHKVIFLETKKLQLKNNYLWPNVLVLLKHMLT